MGFLQELCFPPTYPILKVDVLAIFKLPLDVKWVYIVRILGVRTYGYP